MKRINTDPLNHSVLKWFDKYCRSNNSSLFSSNNIDEKIKNQLLQDINQKKKKENLIYGLRTQSLFAFMIASLNKCVLIKEEDIGELYSNLDNLQRPDFHIILDSGKHLFVEVKNFRTNLKNYKIKKDYIEKLQTYCKLFDIELKIAIYWSKFRMWTLLDPKYFESYENKFQISFLKSSQLNEMHILGDFVIGTIPPLSIKFESLILNRKIINKENEALDIKIEKIDFFANNKQIRNQTEKEITLFLMLYSDWIETELPIEIIDDKTTSFQIQFFPEKKDKNQGFQLIGFLSQLLSNFYNRLTVGENKINTIDLFIQPKNIVKLTSDNYKGDVLKLWRFYIQPKNNNDF